MEETRSLEEFQKLLKNANPPIPGVPEGINLTEYQLRFLRTKNFDADRAFEVYQRYHQMKWKNKELFSQMTPEKLKHVLESGIVTKHPGTDNEGRAIFLFRFKQWDTKDFSMDQVYLASCLLLEEMASKEEFQEKGVVMIHDYEGFGFSHFRIMTMRNFMRILQIMQGNFPLKFKAFHEINQPSLFYILYRLFIPLVSTKLQKRVFMYGFNKDEILTHFPQASIPVSLGGSSETCSDPEFMEMLFKRNTFYEKLANSLN